MTSRQEDGMFSAQSVWMAWKGFDFAQKKQVVRLDHVPCFKRILKRYEE